MESRSGPRRRSCRLRALRDQGGPDLISALPDELLLLVLGRLPCAGAAARTGVLSRRWQGLWARLRRIVFSDVAFHSLEAALGRFPPPPPAVSLLQIRLPKAGAGVPKDRRGTRLNLLLRAAARLDPEELSLVLPSSFASEFSRRVKLPCFHRATSIVLHLCSTTIRCVPASVEFPALETLSLSNCSTDLDALLPCCPRLRRLRLDNVQFDDRVLSVNSPVLQELAVSRARWIKLVNIVAPLLKQLTISFCTYKEATISVSAPMVEKVLWDCYFNVQPTGFGLWRLELLSLQPAPKFPSLHIHAYISSFFGELANIALEMEKQLIAAFSVLELHIETEGHVYGAFVSHVLEMNQIRCAIQRLKVDLQLERKEECPLNCPCEATGWKSQTISLTALEEVEISGFREKDHEFDMLKLILRSAPMLKRMDIKLSHDALASNDGCTEIYDIFRAYSSVQCYVYLSSGLMHDSLNCASM